MASHEVRQSPSGEARFFYGYIVVAAALCIMVTMYGTRSTYGVFFKPMLTEFGWTRAMTSGAFSISIVMQGLMAIGMGGLNDRLGPRIVLTLCGFLLGLGYILMSQIAAVWQIDVFYGVIIGVGMGGILVPLSSTVARWFVTKRNLMTGIVISGPGIGTLIVSPVANWLISAYEWRVSYIILGGLILVVGLLAAQFLRRDPARTGQVPYGENKAGELKLKVGVEGFSLRDAGCTRQFWMLLAMFFCLGFNMLAIAVHIVPHVTDLRISATSATNVLATTGGAGILGSVVLGSAGDRIGNRWVCAISFIMMSVALFWLVRSKELWMLYLFAGVFGFGQIGAAAVQSPLTAQLFGLVSHGLILGVSSFGFAVGAAVGPLITGYISDVTASYQMAFLVCAGVSLLGLVLSLLLSPISDERASRKVSVRL